MMREIDPEELAWLRREAAAEARKSSLPAHMRKGAADWARLRFRKSRR
jgi:hypothetical protein